MQRRMEILRRLERQYIRRALGIMDLPVLDGMVLHQLDLEGRMRQEDLAQCFSVDKGAVARAVSRLEEAGLVTRQVSGQCRREKLTALTEAGQASAAWIQAVLNQWDEIGYQGFTEEERALFDSFLTRITDNVLKFRHREENDG